MSVVRLRRAEVLGGAQNFNLQIDAQVSSLFLGLMRKVGEYHTYFLLTVFCSMLQSHEQHNDSDAAVQESAKRMQTWLSQ